MDGCLLYLFTNKATDINDNGPSSAAVIVLIVIELEKLGRGWMDEFLMKEETREMYIMNWGYTEGREECFPGTGGAATNTTTSIGMNGRVETEIKSLKIWWEL